MAGNWQGRLVSVGSESIGDDEARGNIIRLVVGVLLRCVPDISLCAHVLCSKYFSCVSITINFLYFYLDIL